MADVVITIDVSQVKELGQLFERAGEVATRQLTERLEEHARDEAPEATGRLKSLTGITSNVQRTPNGWEGELIISARSERRGARFGTLHLPSGETKEVKLRAEEPFNYGEAVVKGRKAVFPVEAKLLRIPVTPKKPLESDEAYISADGIKYRLARSAAATPPNDFPGRGAEKLGREVIGIVTAVLRKMVGAV